MIGSETDFEIRKELPVLLEVLWHVIGGKKVLDLFEKVIATSVETFFLNEVEGKGVSSGDVINGHF